jgi:hypothetical protein
MANSISNLYIVALISDTFAMISLIISLIRYNGKTKSSNPEPKNEETFSPTNDVENEQIQ